MRRMGRVAMEHHKLKSYSRKRRIYKKATFLDGSDYIGTELTDEITPIILSIFSVLPLKCGTLFSTRNKIIR